MKQGITFWALLTLFVSLTASSWADTWKDRLKAELESTYVVSKRAALAPDRITKQGTVLIVKQGGITADLSSDATFSVTKVKYGGDIKEGGGFILFDAKTKSRVFKEGEKVYIIDIDVGDDKVMLKLLTCEMFDVVEKGTTKQKRYKGAIKFEFPKGYLDTLSLVALKAVIDPVVVKESESEEIQTKSISLGQTPEEVEAILGKPEKIVDLGSKITYIYKDLKVIFVDGKVSDVQ